MKKLLENGSPLIRTMFYEFPEDSEVLGASGSVHVWKRVPGSADLPL